MYGHSGAIRIMEGLESDITFLTSVNEGNILVGGLTDVEEHPDFMSWDLELENNKLAVCDSWSWQKRPPSASLRSDRSPQILKDSETILLRLPLCFSLPGLLLSSFFLGCNLLTPLCPVVSSTPTTVLPDHMKEVIWYRHVSLIAHYC